ncbi:hypothetical protein GLOTRDRAFT_37622 [Gloeophyllum trabeum ATCC 11539]|uniref:Uncharacterized protein n=1 Tax=Gloeophyllum trabeum (strain ATCC 11539 / FP-39264 / Madison 617) TaxID=670483 RepID=S7QC67_GLOTA|nr:uncharacterized protein GLOTRDRAFT_37622 [Gloeophyllum trabeum ATCC 11539]EPQ56947.1 hypothetical protein GLOTRDRAFT_37622 [Gloeophyllum trabeum ATCC 11539]
MTSASYAREERWAPLPLSARKWEDTAAGPDNRASVGTRASPRPSLHVQDDFAGEAAYERTMAMRERPSAPRMKEEHVWGVREDWGEKASEWGRGVAAYRGREGTGSR